MNDQIRLLNKEHILNFIENYEHIKSQKELGFLKEKDFLSIVQHFEKTDSLNKALETLDIAIKKYKFSPELHAKKAQLLLANNRGELALESLDRAEMFGISFVKTELLRISAYTLLKDFSRALEMLYTLRINHNLSSQELINSFILEADVHKGQNNYDDMYLALKQALVINPSNETALKNIWVSMEMSQKYEDGINFFNYLLDLDAYQHLTWFNLGHAYFSNCEYTKALEAFEFAILTNENFLSAYSDYAETAILQQKYYLAINCLENARSKFELNDEFLLKLGISYQAIKLYDKARTQYFQAATKDQYNPDIYFHIGECYLAEDRYKDALHYFKKALKLDEDNDAYHTAMAKAFAGLNEEEKAIEHFEIASFIAPHEDNSWAPYAKYLLSLNQEEKALEVLNEAGEYTVGSTISYLKAATHYRLGNKEMTLKELEEGLIENFNDNHIFLNLLPSSVLLKDRQIAGIFRYYQV